jgi:hypothetical protein
LDDHDVPDSYIADQKSGKLIYGLRSVLEGKDINKSILRSDSTSVKCFLNDYDFDGMAYTGLEGAAMLFWNFNPQLLRITGVRDNGDSAFKGIPAGATYKDVDDIYHGRAIGTDKATIAPSIYAPADMLQLAAEYTLVISEISKIVTRLQDTGKISTYDAIILESWFFRTYKSNRKSVYGNIFDDRLYEVICLSAAVSACASPDSKATLKIAYTADNADIRYLAAGLLPFSLQNHHSAGLWKEALHNIGFTNHDIVTVVPELAPTSDGMQTALQCLHGMISNGINGGISLLKYVTAFAQYFNTIFPSKDLIAEYNKLHKSTMKLFISDVLSGVSKKIESISASGVEFK